MDQLTRRSLLVSGLATAAQVFAIPAEAATGSVSIDIFRAGFIVGVAGGGGTLTFGGRRFPLSVGGVSAGATIGLASVQLIGTASRMGEARDLEGVYSAPPGPKTLGVRTQALRVAGHLNEMFIPARSIENMKPT